MGRTLNRNRMSKSERREQTRQHRIQKRQSNLDYGTVVPFQRSVRQPRSVIARVSPLNDKQALLIATIVSNTLTFATGCAGTGKSFIAIGTALKALDDNQIEQLILTKPDFQIDERIGIFPGGPEEKTALLFRSFKDIILRFVGHSHYENLLRLGKIKYEPLGSILGTTFDNAFIIMDESQNSTPGQVKSLLTRLGKNSKAVICGDYKEQVFLAGRNGLEDAVRRFGGVNRVGLVDFEIDDIVRDEFVKEVIKAYRKK